MKLPSLVLLSAPLATALTIQPPSSPSSSSFRIPTPGESATLARRILNLSKIGTLSTVFQPSSHSQLHSHHEVHDGSGYVTTPDLSDALAGVPIGLPDYFADCDPDETGNPVILAIDIATSFRNVRAGSNISLAVQWQPPYPPSKRISLWSWFLNDSPAPEEPPDPLPYSVANLPRFSLVGYLESFPESSAALAECFVAKHPDARYWLPGSQVHRSHWARLVVTKVYWVGGFGDRAYIGWIPIEQYHNVTRDEWESARLPGEKPDWKEWSNLVTATGGSDADL